MHSFDIGYNEEKNELLRKTRGICFEDVTTTLEGGDYIITLKNNKRDFEHQQILVVKINNYIHAVPFVWKDKEKKVAFLKTVYPDRYLHNIYK